jgi:hypothetical protein
MAMQIKAWMTNFLFKKILYFFTRSILRGISLDQTLIKTNIMARFKTTRIWPLNPNAMDEKKKPQ